MKPLNWQELKSILNKVNKEHKVTLTATSQQGRFTSEEQGKAIRLIIPVIDMSTLEINTLSITDNNGKNFTFTIKAGKSKTLYEEIINWLDDGN